MSEKLKPCPWGDESCELSEAAATLKTDKGEMQVYFVTCFQHGQSAYCSDPGIAKNTWNTRPEDPVKKAAEAIYQLEDRDTHVNDKGRPTSTEWGLAWQTLGEALGRIGTAAQANP